jgi:hypothetical protein
MKWIAAVRANFMASKGSNYLVVEIKSRELFIRFPRSARNIGVDIEV